VYRKNFSNSVFLFGTCGGFAVDVLGSGFNSALLLPAFGKATGSAGQAAMLMASLLMSLVARGDPLTCQAKIWSQSSDVNESAHRSYREQLAPGSHVNSPASVRAGFPCRHRLGSIHASILGIPGVQCSSYLKRRKVHFNQPAIVALTDSGRAFVPSTDSSASVIELHRSAGSLGYCLLNIRSITNKIDDVVELRRDVSADVSSKRGMILMNFR
jgi:hypothetical protein